MVALTQLTRPLPGAGCVGFDRFVHRHLQLFLDGLRAPARSVLVGTAATLEDLQSLPCQKQFARSTSRDTALKTSAR